MKKVIVAAAAAATLLTPALATASISHKSTKHVTVHVCVNVNKKHGKARLAKNCKNGEKSLTLHLVVPAGAPGAPGATGATGAQGPAGNGVTLKDAKGNVVGTLVGYLYGDAEVLLNDGSLEQVDPMTGHIAYEQGIYFASSDCTGTPYTWYRVGPQSPFATPGHSAVGDPLYQAASASQTITVGSQLIPGYPVGSPATCDSTDYPVGQAQTVYPLVPAGTITVGDFTGPLTVTK